MLRGRRRHAIPRWLRERMLSLRALTAEAENAHSDDSDPHEGRGAFGCAILSALVVVGIVVGMYSAYALR